MEEELKLFETPSQFVVIEEGIIPPKNVQIYHLKQSDDVRRRYVIDFPQYELYIESFGVLGWGWSMMLSYRGLKLSLIGIGDFKIIPRLLNQLKGNDYQKEMLEFFKENSYKEEDFEKIKPILEIRFNIKYWEKKIDILNQKIGELEEENSALKK